MKKRIILKSWLVKVLGTILASYIFFVGITIENLGTGNVVYNKIFFSWSGLAIISIYLLIKYSKVFEN